MSHLPDPLHQPPNDGDMQQVPPTTPECARIRGLLRDFADGDLAVFDYEDVEQHVHDCRTCALALARAEYEVLRLRRAFLGNWAAVGPRPGFARRTVERLLREEPDAVPLAGSIDGPRAANTDDAVVEPMLEALDDDAMLDADRLAAELTGDLLSDLTPREGARAGGARPGRNLKRRVLERATAELTRTGIADDGADDGAGRRSGRRRNRGSSRSWLLASTIGAALAVLVVAWAWQETANFAASVRLSVVSAERVWSDHGDSLRKVQAGDGLDDGSVLRVDPHGYADCEFHDRSMTGKQPAAKIRLEGDGELRIDGGVPRLMRGTIAVETERPMSVLLADGSTAELGAGQYHVNVTEAASFDELMAAGGIAVQVEVLRGEPARLEREGGAEAIIAINQMGFYNRGLAGIAVENLPAPPSGVVASGGRQPVEDEPDYPDLVGYVRDAVGNPLAAADVTVRFQVGGYGEQPAALRTRQLTTDTSGRFELPSGSGIRDGFAVVEVRPSDLDQGIGQQVPELMPLLRAGAGYELAPIVLAYADALVGRVVDAQDQPVRWVRIVPVVFDELLGQILPLRFDGAFTDDNGAFTLRRLPTSLPAYQSLAVFAFHQQFDCAFRLAPLPGSAAARLSDLNIRLQPLAEILLANLWPGSNAEILQEPFDLQVRVPGGGMRHVQIERTGSSTATAAVGRGRMWLRSGNSTPARVRLLERGSDGAYRPGPSQLLSEVFRPMVDVPGVGGMQLAQQTRFDNFQPGAPATVLWPQDPTGAMSGGAQVFAMTPHEDLVPGLRFLGYSRDQDGIATEVQPNEIVTVLSGADGAVRSALVHDLWDGGRYGPIRMQVSGRIELSPAWQSAAGYTTLQFQPLNEAAFRPAFERIVTVLDQWTVQSIPAGTYTVVKDGAGLTATVTVAPGATTSLH